MRWGAEEELLDCAVERFGELEEHPPTGVER